MDGSVFCFYGVIIESNVGLYCETPFKFISNISLHAAAFCALLSSGKQARLAARTLILIPCFSRPVEGSEGARITPDKILRCAQYDIIMFTIKQIPLHQLMSLLSGSVNCKFCSIAHGIRKNKV